jgi:hypothetical protein
MNIVIELNEIEVKALSYVMADPQEWIQNAISERARIAGDELVASETARLLADPDVTEIPANRNTIILGAPDLDSVETSTSGEL